jgi:hypothetical protein
MPLSGHESLKRAAERPATLACFNTMPRRATLSEIRRGGGSFALHHTKHLSGKYFPTNANCAHEIGQNRVGGYMRGASASGKSLHESKLSSTSQRVSIRSSILALATHVP